MIKNIATIATAAALFAIASCASAPKKACCGSCQAPAVTGLSK